MGGQRLHSPSPIRPKHIKTIHPTNLLLRIMNTRMKKTLICGGVTSYTLDTELPQYHIPQVGDVAVFEVLSLGKHLTVQADSRLIVKIMPGDQIMAAFGHRYATEQFEGYVPEQCQPEFHILGAGGTVGWVHSTHAKFSGGGPTRLKIIGYATNERGEIINTRKMNKSRMVPFTGAAASQTRVVLSVGSSMDSGKTTSAAYLVHGLARKGRRVTFIKLTGTVFTKDCDLAYDLGAHQALDFSDFGFPSTFMCTESELLDLYESLLNRALESEPDYVVMEIADGIYQRETKMLLNNARFMSTVQEVMFSACDSLAAVHGVQTLRNWGIAPFALCGMFTTSPLLMKEVREYVDVPVFTLDQLTREGVQRLLSRPQLPVDSEVPVYAMKNHSVTLADVA